MFSVRRIAPGRPGSVDRPAHVPAPCRSALSPLAASGATVHRVSIGRAAAAAALLLGTVLAGSGCTATGTAPPPSLSQSPATASTPAATGTATAAPSASAAETPVPARTDPDAPARQRADAALDVTVQPDPEGGGAGHTDSFVVFRNTGSSPCDLAGAPGVSLVGHDDGTQLGRSAAHIPGAKTPVVHLKGGGTAVAELVYSVVDANGGIYGDGDGHDPQCEATQADGYRVYPPHSFRSVFVREAKLYACTTDVNWISVQPVRARITGFTPKP